MEEVGTYATPLHRAHLALAILNPAQSPAWPPGGDARSQLERVGWGGAGGVAKGREPETPSLRP